jgi:ABC-2 type transport system permease protein
MTTGTGRAAVAIAAKDLRRRIRDRTAILVGVVLPFALAGIFSLTLGDAESGTFTATFAIADEDGGELPEAFAETLRGLDFVTLEPADDAGEAERMAESGEVDAAFVFPEGFSEGASAARGGTITIVTHPGDDVAGLVAGSVAGSFASRIDAVAVSVAVALPAGEHDPDATTRVVAAARDAPPVSEVVADDAASHQIGATTFFAIGMAVFFLFFTVEFGVRGLLEERAEGTLARLLVSPIPPSAVLLGKALASFAVGIVSTTLLVVASTLLLDAIWGEPLGVALLVLAGVATAVAVTALVTTLASTPAQAGSYASIVAVVGGLLGGTFFPISQAPGILASLRFLSPQGWLMEGFQTLASGSNTAAAIPALAGTLVIGGACGAVAWMRASRIVAR